MTSTAIIPVRNRPHLISAAVASILKQTFPVDELIIIDDGSTDETPGVISELARTDSRIRPIFLPQPGGASLARNVGIEAAQCEWICFLDSDDRWMPEKHERQVAELEKKPDVIAAFTGCRNIYHKHSADVLPLAEVGVKDLRKRNFIGTTSSAMVRRSAILAVGGFDAALPSCQDWDLWIKLRNIGEFALICEPLVEFDQTQEIRITHNKSAVLEGHRIVFNRILSEMDNGLEKRRVIANHCCRMAEIYLHDLHEPKTALINSLKSLTIFPTKRGVRLLWETSSAQFS